jgi:hypothetical protein
LVDWLHTNVNGFHDRKDARKFAARLLKEGYIRHTVNKITFSDQCYYVLAAESNNAGHAITNVPAMDLQSLSLQVCVCAKF